MRPILRFQSYGPLLIRYGSESRSDLPEREFRGDLSSCQQSAKSKIASQYPHEHGCEPALVVSRRFGSRHPTALAPAIPTRTLACPGGGGGQAGRILSSGVERIRLQAAAGSEQALQEFLDDAARFPLASAVQSGEIVRDGEGEADKTGKRSRNLHDPSPRSCTLRSRFLTCRDSRFYSVRVSHAS